MKKVINYAHLARKYLGVEPVVHDRTYEGMEFPAGTTKPAVELFAAFQREEERLAQADENHLANNLGLMQEKQHQARQAALEAIRPLEEKFKEEESSLREEVERLRMAALELQERFQTREELLECWQEIGAAQALVNAEAEAYLADTDFFVTRKQETGEEIPGEITQKRAEARARIDRGNLVYRKWEKLREAERPSRKEIQAAIQAGGEELARIKKVCEEVALRYPRPRRQRSY